MFGSLKLRRFERAQQNINVGITAVLAAAPMALGILAPPMNATVKGTVAPTQNTILKGNQIGIFILYFSITRVVDHELITANYGRHLTFIGCKYSP